MNPKKFRGWCSNGCGNEIKKGATKYCSFKCQHEFHFAKRVAVLEAGAYHVDNARNFIRKYLVRIQGEKCSRCGWAERHPVTGKIPIEVEHIDGDWRNNHPSNLTLICPSCHSLTATYRALNRGRGREHRAGSRTNPSGKARDQSKRPATHWQLEVLALPSPQLRLFENADVAERLNAPDL